MSTVDETFVVNDDFDVDSLTYEQTKSLYLHKAVLAELLLNKNRVINVAYENIRRGMDIHRSDGMSVKYLNEWKKILDSGDVELLRNVFESVDEYSCELRVNSPFAGVLTMSDRLKVLREFKEFWMWKGFNDEE